MNEPPPVTDEVFTAFLKCRYKAYLKLRGAAGEPSEYEQVQARLAAEYRAGARQELLHGRAGAVVERLASAADAIRDGAALVLDTTVSDGGESCRLDALEEAGEKSPGSKGPYRPVLFVRREKVTADDKLLLAFGGGILARLQGAAPAAGRIVHGGQFKSSRVELTCLEATVREAVGEIRGLQQSPEPPPLRLNKHCPECEFRTQCRAAAVAKDDLSLLRGLSEKEVAALNGRGIFTVTQYSYTFRPGRMKRAAERAGKKHDHSLQALAIREKTVYVAQRPQLPGGKALVYLDVEGQPDESFYYLIGLTLVEGNDHRRLAFWADTKVEEAAVWASFLAAVQPLADFVLLHYGSYESRFLDQMEARHGGDPGLIGRIRAASVNVLSLLYGRVYFPAYANDLKSVAGCLGFRWSAPDPSGLHAVAWRCRWEATGDESLKQLLLTYNEEDRSALERVADMLRGLGSDGEGPGPSSGPRVASVADAPGPYRHQFGATAFALPEFARITKCAYCDYQRDRVLCRTGLRGRKVARPGKGRKKRAWKVNQEVEWGRPTACPDCGSTGSDLVHHAHKLVIDLKPFRGGLKRWVTRHKTRRWRCRKCLGTFLPEGYLAQPPGYGRGLCGWVVYASVSLRQTNEAIAEALEEWFGVRFGRGYASKIRQRAVETYRATWEGLLAALRNGPLVHADETRVKIKGAAGTGYVWVFASPETAVYVYAPTRDGVTARGTLAGFKGVLVSDFYAAYDSLECPQQKCLVHLIRDLNDDLLKHPFDEELKRQAARFTAVLQPVIETIDRYGLKRYHLNKHKKDVDRFYATESRADYRSERAGHYQSRFLKYREKLFTFLDHDGVPWNNNMAENAVKRFVSRRKIVGTPFTEDGIRDYLLLLSIAQTLRYRDASFWRFLLSGETDIEAFAARRR
jgi:predicted RecB family nuclease